MIKNLILASCVVLLAAILTFGLNAYFKTNKGDFFILEKGKPVPDFAFETLNGDNYSLSDFVDKTVIIHFWASWCAPCVVEFPELIKLATQRPNSVILGFSTDRTRPAIDRFFDRYEFDLPDNFKIIHDPQETITEGKFSVFRLPESFIIKPNMILDDHIIGAYKGWVDLDL